MAIDVETCTLPNPQPVYLLELQRNGTRSIYTEDHLSLDPSKRPSEEPTLHYTSIDGDTRGRYWLIRYNGKVLILLARHVLLEVRDMPVGLLKSKLFETLGKRETEDPLSYFDKDPNTRFCRIMVDLVDWAVHNRLDGDWQFYNAAACRKLFQKYQERGGLVFPPPQPEKEERLPTFQLKAPTRPITFEDPWHGAWSGECGENAMDGRPVKVWRLGQRVIRGCRHDL